MINENDRVNDQNLPGGRFVLIFTIFKSDCNYNSSYPTTEVSIMIIAKLHKKKVLVCVCMRCVCGGCEHSVIYWVIAIIMTS